MLKCNLWSLMKNKICEHAQKDIIKNKDWQSSYLNNNKEKLNLRFHQELITQKTSNLIEKGKQSFLWGCKCRSGKTYSYSIRKFIINFK